MSLMILDSPEAWVEVELAVETATCNLERLFAVFLSGPVLYLFIHLLRSEIDINKLIKKRKTRSILRFETGDRHGIRVRPS